MVVGERSYYTDLARAIPQDCLIMTLACGKNIAFLINLILAH